jgi:hypothetical protein
MPEDLTPFPHPSTDAEEYTLVVRMPDGRWRATCSGCGATAFGGSLDELFPESDVPFPCDADSPLRVVCPACPPLIWRAYYE